MRRAQREKYLWYISGTFSVLFIIYFFVLISSMPDEPIDFLFDEQSNAMPRSVTQIQSGDLMPSPKTVPPEMGKVEPQGGKGKRHRGEEGQMGRRAAKKSDVHYGIRGTGRGGGGTAEGTLGLGSLHTIGHGGGGGTVSGYGRGAGGLAARVRSGGPSFIGDPRKVYWPGHNTEAYSALKKNRFLDPRHNPLSTFSIDVDTASYANMRRFLNENTLPPEDAVRVEELVNYFSYEYPPPSDGEPFSIHTETCRCPWNEAHILARIGLRGKEIPEEKRPPANLVFLIDVSGSMQPFNKLPLLKRALAMLVDRLDRRDKVSIVVYAGASGLVLPATRCDAKAEILQAIEGLGAGGSTNGGAGIELAYRIATREFISGGVNRVILATDGDFNVGVTSEGALTRLIVDKAKSGVYLSVLGVGMGNFKDSTLEKLADKGNGNYAYFDTLHEARKVLVEQMGSTLVTIAEDVKIQVEFNPTTVGAYRLIGYENRLLAAEDFNDDSKDAGEIGTGHTVTALYEIVPPEAAKKLAQVDRLKYQKKEELTGSATNDELFTVKLRFKKPGQGKSALVSRVVANAPVALGEATSDTRFAAAVAGFAMLLRKSENSGSLVFNDVLGLARESLGPDPYSRRSQFIELVEKAKELKSQ